MCMDQETKGRKKKEKDDEQDSGASDDESEDDESEGELPATAAGGGDPEYLSVPATAEEKIVADKLEFRKRLDGIRKVRQALQAFLKRCHKFRFPDQNLCIDEALGNYYSKLQTLAVHCTQYILVPFKGKIWFRVYIQSKPHKYGVK